MRHPRTADRAQQANSQPVPRQDSAHILIPIARTMRTRVLVPSRPQTSHHPDTARTRLAVRNTDALTYIRTHPTALREHHPAITTARNPQKSHRNCRHSDGVDHHLAILPLHLIAIVMAVVRQSHRIPRATRPQTARKPNARLPSQTRLTRRQRPRQCGTNSTT